MQIKLKFDYNPQHKKGSDGAGLSDDLKARLVKVGLAEEVKAPKKTETKED